MIVRITGTVADVDTDAVVLETEGLAREVLIPHYALGELAACRGRQVTLHTFEYLEGNPNLGHLTPRLLGFLHAEDRRFFKKFVSVKGIGFRKALKALAQPVGQVAAAIEGGDKASLSKLPGLGKRAAELIIAELQGKVNEFALGGVDEAEVAADWSQAQRDALDVMVSLGDGRADAQRWLARAAQLHPDLASADDWMRAAYKVRSGVE